ncbi:MAG: phosphatase PAP2 family protein [Candidatus Gracilibacteria bacterium]
MDLQLAIFINKLGAGTALDLFTSAMNCHSIFISILTALVLAALIFDKKNQKKIFIAVLIAIALHFLINELFFKDFLGYFTDLRIRPYIAHPDLITALGTNSDASFPSSHTSLTAAVLTVLTYFYRKYWPVWPLAILFLLFMAFSRVHNGMHYPTDVLAGAVLGIIYGAIAIKIAKTD